MQASQQWLSQQKTLLRTASFLVDATSKLYDHLVEKQIDKHQISLEERRHKQPEKQQEDVQKTQEEQRKFEQFMQNQPNVAMSVFLREIEVRCFT
eukprot:4817563-Karenia_brevis.AAC.1